MVESEELKFKSPLLFHYGIGFLLTLPALLVHPFYALLLTHISVLFSILAGGLEVTKSRVLATLAGTSTGTMILLGIYQLHGLCIHGYDRAGIHNYQYHFERLVF